MASLRAFVSHSHADNAWCDGFVAELKNTGLDVWYDRDGLYVGDQWVPTIERELQGRDNFLIVLTPDSLASLWVQREFSLALAQNKRIIGVLHRPTQVSGFLTTFQHLDVTRLDERQAAQAVVDALKGMRAASWVPAPMQPKQPFVPSGYDAGARAASWVPAPTQPKQPVMPSGYDGRIDGEWRSEGNANIELFLTGATGSGTTHYLVIKGTGEHWLCGSVTIAGRLDGPISLTEKRIGDSILYDNRIEGSARVQLKLTPVRKSTISHVKLDLTLLQGKMRGYETHYERGGLFSKEKDTYPLTLLWTDH